MSQCRSIISKAKKSTHTRVSNARVLEAFAGATFGTARSRIEGLAASLTADDAALLVKPEIRRFL